MSSDEYPESSHYVNRRQSSEERKLKYQFLTRICGLEAAYARVLRDHTPKSIARHLYLELCPQRTGEDAEQ